MRKRHIQTSLFIFICTLGFVVSACEVQVKTEGPVKSTAQLEKENLDEERKIKVGFSMDTLEEERWLRDKFMFKEAVKSLGAEIEIMEANGNEARQISQVEFLISRGVDVLVVVPYNAEAAAAIVKKAHLAGIKVISYDRLIKNAEIDLYISFDNEKVGELQAKAITKRVPRGKYVYIGGADTDNNAHLIKKGVFKVLQPFIEQGDIEVVYDQWTKDWIPVNAYTNMKAALKANDNQIDAVIAANDATAGEVIKALAEEGLAGKIPVAGQDAELAASRRVIEGSQTVTVYKPIKLLTEEAAKIVIKVAKGETIKTERKINNGKIEVPSILLAPIAVDRENMDDTIIADGFHSKENVYENMD